MVDLTNVDRVRVLLRTDEEEGAGTDGNVYLGICGREFNLNQARNDYEAGDRSVVTLGQGATVSYENNDPRDPQLYVETVDLFPVYLRFEPSRPSDRWKLRSCAAVVNNGAGDDGGYHYWRPFIFGPLWLGLRSGLSVYMWKFNPIGPDGFAVSEDRFADVSGDRFADDRAFVESQADLA